MSLRFHRGAPVVTLFHDARSPLSREALSLLRTHAARVVLPSQASGGLLSATLDAAAGRAQAAGKREQGQQHSAEHEAFADEGPDARRENADQWLRRAAGADESGSAPGASGAFGEFELQVQDRRAQPPTDSQMRSILQYLKATPVPPHARPQARTTAEASEQSSPPDLAPDAGMFDEGGADSGSFLSGADGGSGGGGGGAAESKATLTPEAAARLRKVRDFQRKANEARDAAERERQAKLLGADVAVQALPRPPLDASGTAGDAAAAPAPASAQPAEAEAAAAPPRAHASHLLDHLQASSSPAGAPSLREGPLCVWWDEGMAATSVAGVEAMLERMKELNAQNAGSSAGSGSCAVM